MTQMQNRPYFTIALIAQNDIALNNSKILGSYIGIYTTNLWISYNSTISSQGFGCAQSQGYGCGFLDWVMGLRLQCGGTGASHGGMGGQSSSPSQSYIQTCLQMTSRDIYDDPFDPIFEGSGGGGQNISAFSGKGGGVIYIESALQVTVDGLIDCSGQGSIQYQLSQFYGSGSGGSLQIHTILLLGSGLIQSNGGGSQHQQNTGFGGSGGAGRIKINLTQWYQKAQQEALDTQFQNLSKDLSVSAIGGVPYSNLVSTQRINSSEQQGSIITTPCLSGYEISYQNSSNSSFICSICPNGYYKFQINSGQCMKCANSQDGWVYNTTNSVRQYQLMIQYSPICQVIQCLETSTSNQGHFNKRLNICQSDTQYIVMILGGQNGVFAILVALFLFLISVFIYLFKKSNKNKDQFNNQAIIESIDPDNIMAKREESSTKTNFVVEDLPYHIQRLYLTGNNSYNKPWQIYPSSEQQFAELSDKIPLENLFKQFNQSAQYSFFHKWILLFFRYYYYPVYYQLLEYIRRSKFQNLSEFLNKHKVEAINPNETGVFFKFSASSDYTLAYIDILDYKQDVLNWSNQTQFPVTFVLQGSATFLFPLSINLSDPLLKSLHLTFLNHLLPNLQEDEQEDKQHISALEHFVSDFNKHSKLIDFRQTLQSFQKYCIDITKFTEQQNTDIFNKTGVQIDILIHIMENNATKEFDKSKFILVKTIERKKFEQWIEDVHNMQNFLDDFTIRFSVNFDLVKKGKEPYKDQIGMIASNNLNRQIAQYKQLEDEREQLNNLKLAMKRRIEGEEEKKAAIKPLDNQEQPGGFGDYFCQNYANYVNFNEMESVCVPYYEFTRISTKKKITKNSQINASSVSKEKRLQ